MRSAVTLCRVPEAAAGPFVFHEPLAEGFAKAKAAGFDAVELFLPGPEAVAAGEILRLCERHGLAVAAVGTGAGWLRHGLSLSDPDPARRAAALEFLLAMVEFGGRLGAPAIVGSLQGRAVPGIARGQALEWLAAGLKAAAEAAAGHGQALLCEPLNRYETNLLNRLAETVEWLEAEAPREVLVLADLFHMNIEEADPAAALRAAGQRVGHVHFADSNRRAMGFGHTDPVPLIAALQASGFRACLSAEILPLPDPETAARRTIDSLRALLPAT